LRHFPRGGGERDVARLKIEQGGLAAWGDDFKFGDAAKLSRFERRDKLRAFDADERGIHHAATCGFGRAEAAVELVTFERQQAVDLGGQLLLRDEDSAVVNLGLGLGDGWTSKK
jgi:hypothetical protein